MPHAQERERMCSDLMELKKLIDLKLGGEYFGHQSDVQITVLGHNDQL